MFPKMMSNTCPALMAVVITTALCLFSAPLVADPSSETEFSALNEAPLAAHSQWRTLSGAGHPLWVAYYDRDRQLWLRHPDGRQQRLDRKEDGQAPSGLSMAANAERARVAWRDKVPSKGLFVLDTGDDDPQEISGESEALARFHLLPGDTGTHALWYGEKRHEETGALYNLHYNFITDSGEVGEQQWLMPGMYPIGLADGDRFAAFSWVTQGTDEPHIAMRQREAGSPDFSDSRILDSGIENLSPVYMAEASGDHWVVLWQTMQRDGVKERSLDGVRSPDRGETWETFSIEGLRGFDSGRLSMAMEGSEIAVAVTGRWRDRNDPQEYTYFVRSPDGGASWSEPREMRDPGQFPSRAPSAQVVRGSDASELWVVWEDWRQIRPRIYGAYSRDFGKTFEWEDRPVSPATLKRAGLSGNAAARIETPEGLELVANRYASDSFDQLDLVPFSLPREPVDHDMDPPPRLTDTGYLKERVTQYWAAMQERDHEASYALLDPFTRNAWDLLDYRGRQGPIKYHDFEIGEVVREGHLADVSVTITASVPAFRHGGEEISVPERTINFTERWLFVDGDWYREYEEKGSELRFTRYRR